MVVVQFLLCNYIKKTLILLLIGQIKFNDSIALLNITENV